MSIRQLAPDVAAKIAAGEVVERPASVVKELIENSIDAGATQLRVELAHGGLQLIRITDNGSGIAADELPLALERHATSKVAQIDDLEHIRSLGFRGEALASIAAVAEVTLLSRPHDAERGAQINAFNGQISEVTAAAAAAGTTITVRNLFSSVPARLKFLKSRNTEVSHCHHLLEQYALAYPEIRFSVFSDGRQLLATPGDGQLRSVLIEVYGLQVAEQMVPIISSEQAENSEYPVVAGHVSRPSCYKSTRQHISFFVNRRWVLSRMLTAAVEGAYHSLLLTGRHPLAVINIQMDPTLLDVNVHPAKTEIRFLKERRVFAAVLRAVRQALLEEPEMPQWQPEQKQGRHAASPAARTSTEGETAVEEEELDSAAIFSSAEEEPPGSQEERPAAEEEQVGSNEEMPEAHAEAENSFPVDNPWITVSEEETGTKPPISARLWQSHIRSVNPAPETRRQAASAANTASTQEDRPVQRGIAQQTARVKPRDEEWKQASVGDTNVGSVTQTQRADDWLPQRPVVSDEALAEQVIDPQQARRMPHLRVVGQIAQSYIVCEGDDGSMYLIDQHAAHERILLERMIASMKARTPIAQLLLTPIQLELAPGELEALEEHQAQLTQIGFKLESNEDGTLDIRAVPGVLVKQMNVRSLQELMVELTAEESLGHTETWEERALANVACKAAIKANYFLTISEMREMLEQLEQTKAPYSCCHGRPTMVHFSPSALARAFERR